ncbi:myosin heavy chain, cardiac muscle isoform isoform X2 [Bombus flavifrons]|uniref:myosin heavy chain, cardiac muscle isoform isoform X2 n=1 Tax=Bombus flavifrons TaxID=103934 RepID=UPI003703DA59
MGAAGSSSSAPFSSADFRRQSEETFVYGTEESCCPEYANENIRQRTRTSAFDVGEEPRSQGPSPYATFRGEERSSQRPSAPSLSNLRSPRRETLLTYAAQMTGWQTAEEHSPSFSQQNQKAMEVISQLAMANQQLASANTATLANLEALYMELSRERELRRRVVSSETLDEALRKRLTMDEERDDEDERRRMEIRIERLESLLRKIRSRIERLETVVKTRGFDREDERQSSTSICDSKEIQDSNCRQTIDDLCDRLPNSIEVPEHEFKTQVDEARAKTVSRVSVAYVEEDVRSSKWNDGDRSNLHLKKSKVEAREGRLEDEVEQGVDKKEVTRLLKEVERLMAERSEYQCENERLVKELTEEKAIVRKLTKAYKEAKTQHEEVESRLEERRHEYENLMTKFDVATKETERLLKEIDNFNVLKGTAEAKISSLEQDLQKSLLEKEEIINIESQRSSELKAQLSEEISDKKKQIKALEDALDEIQRLKETIKTERKGEDDDDLKEDIGPVESIDDPQESPPVDRTTNIEDFKKELIMKREARQRAIAAVSSEMERLRRELDAEKEAHSETSRMLDLLRSAQKDEQAQTIAANDRLKKSREKDQKASEHELAAQRLEAQRLTSILKISDELRNDIRIQMDKVDDLRYHLETEPDQHRYRIRCLSDITNRSREAVYFRERAANDLKDHLAEILLQLGDRSFLEQKDDVGLECERQLENINSLKSLYNERLKVLNELKETAVRELAETRVRLDHSLKKCECLEEDLKKADEKIDTQDTEISNLESQLGLTKADCRDLQNQMSLINSLFTQMLLGATSADMDLDRLTQLLQENHDLICNMAREEGTEAAALPKLLLDLIEQVEGSKPSQKRADGENGTEVEAEKKEDDLQQEDIAHNLPKVWRVLLELLSCHAECAPSASAASSSDPNICYKSVDTPAGPRLVISVSKTYIRLKELILEKKHLEKEMNRMKQLNVHLECKLGEQEKRLSTVSAELSKTWTIVDRMQAQHHQLHTHEKILRYELQQKRKMLQELKQELEYCREKWESARQKNTNTELEWRSLRREFAARKALASHDSFNNSAESGFSDERGDDTDEEDNAVEGRIRLGPRRRPRKESPRAPTPDTESEQPTDTELSEPKTGSSATLEQRTPTPETEAELDETEVAEVTLNAESTNESPLIPGSPQESLNPLDQALTNVIQNLIGIESSINVTSATFEAANDDNVTEDIKGDHMVPTIESWSTSLPEPEGVIVKDVNKAFNLNTPVQTHSASTSIAMEDARSTTNTDVFGASLSNGQVSSSFDTPTSEDMVGSKEKRPTKPMESVVDSDNVSVGSSSSIETVKEFATTESASSSSPGEIGKRDASSAEAGGSGKQEDKKVPGAKSRTPEEALAAREDRLKRLEEQAKWLMNKMSATNRRGSALSTRLEELHEVYGEPPVPPPMPDVLPSRRLGTTLSDLPRQVPESSTTEDAKNTEKPDSSGVPNEPPPDNTS